MKRLFYLVLIIFILCFSLNLVTVNAKEYKCLDSKVNILRAGGGSSGGSGGSGGGGSASSHGGTHGGRSSRGSTNIFNEFLHLILLIVFFFPTVVFLILKVFRSSINSKRYLKLLKKDDPVWNYKEIEKQVIKSFYYIQEGWTKQNLEEAKEYLDESIYNSFTVKLNWMQYNNKKNILKRIRLRNLKPISIHDDEDDEKDCLWFYIRGSMIDYTINTETNEKLEGINFPMPFIEFWQFRRTKEDKWVLSKIYQKDEMDKINFE